MHFTIRQGVFETNSSSMHSWTTMGDKILEGSPVERNLGEYEDDATGRTDIITLDGHFGWGYELYNGSYDKAKYLLQLADEETYDDLDRADILDAIENYLHSRVYLNVTKNHGYVDHQSCEDVKKFLHGLTPEEWIFNNQYVLVIDNDNH